MSEPQETPAASPSESTEPEIARVRDLAELSPEEAQHLENTAVYAVVRRAPKFRAFFTVGALVGIVLGLVVGFTLSEPGMVNRGIYVTVCVLFTTMMTSLVTGFIASQLDRRSVAALEPQEK